MAAEGLSPDTTVRLTEEAQKMMEEFLAALSKTIGRTVSGPELATMLTRLRQSGTPIDLSKPADLDRLVRELRSDLAAS